MGAADTLITELLKRVFDVYDRRRAAPSITHKSFHDALGQHLRDVAAWSERVEFLGFAAGRQTDVATVDLLIAVPRKFSGSRTSSKSLDEWQLITSGHHYMLLGDPGGGKTTTLKRLCRRFLTEGCDLGDTYQYPVAVRLRELNEDRLLDEAIADALGIPHERIPTRPRKILIDRGISLSQFTQVELGEPFVVAAGTQPLAIAIAELIDATGGVLLLDGLDEMPPPLRPRAEHVIEVLARHIRESKLVVSCRSGDYSIALEGFDALEIRPLTAEQILTVAHKWCSDAADFVQRLQALPFADLATRPLFLCQLILLYETTGFLPSDPSAVYRRVVRLALEEWDRQRKISRPTRYARFDPDRKLKFLAHLAFRLTYELKAKRFSTDDLVRTYREICDNFALPLDEALPVAREIETHTGIFVESSAGQYEFSHLSLQEYLCAEFILGVPLPSKIGAYLVHDPEPMAVAVGISAHPSRWLASLFLRTATVTVFRSVDLESFFARLEQEAPELGVDKLLGFAALRILFLTANPGPYTERFLTRSSVEASIGEVLPAYAATLRGDVYDLELIDSPWAATRDADVPTDGTLSHERVSRIAQRVAVRFKTLQ